MATNLKNIDSDIHAAGSVDPYIAVASTDQEAEPVNAYAKTKAQLRSINQEIKAAKEQLQKVNKRLSSWSLAAMEAVGLSVDDVTEDPHLFVLPNEKLSRHDLTRKQELLTDRIGELAAQLRSDYAIIRQLKVNAQLERHQQLGAYAKQYKSKVFDEYKANPKQFFANNTPDIEQQWSGFTKEIMLCADKLIIVAELFTDATDIIDIWRGWRVVARARNLASEKYNSSILRDKTNKPEHRETFQQYEKYIRGAKRYIEILTSLLPPGLQGLQILYADRDFDRVEYYLQEVFTKKILSSDPEYLQLLVDLAAEVHDTCLRTAAKELHKNLGFASLNHKVANLMVREQAYLIQLKFDVEFLRGFVADVDIKKLQQYLHELEMHIRGALTEKASIATLEAEFGKIRLQIDAQASAMQNMFLPSNHAPLPEPLVLGSGLGFGWLYGIKNMPQQLRSNTKVNQQKISLADDMDVGDYKFIIAEDSFWQRSIKPTQNSAARSNVFAEFSNAFRSLLSTVRGDNEALGFSHYIFTVPDKLLIPMERIAPGFGAKLAAHFQRKANDIHMAIEQANKIDDATTAEIIIRDLDQLETEWLRIMRSVHVPDEFYTAVDLYLTTQYALLRTQYIEIAKDLRRQPYIEQERKVLLFEYQHEREEIQDLHNLKDILQQVVRPNR